MRLAIDVVFVAAGLVVEVRPAVPPFRLVRAKARAGRLATIELVAGAASAAGIVVGKELVFIDL